MSDRKRLQSLLRVYVGETPEEITDEDILSKERRPNGYYDDFGNLRRELGIIIEENDGEFPLWSQLEKERRSDIIHGVRKHGGLRAVKERMGYESDVKPYGYWGDPNNIFDESRTVIEDNEFETLPNKEILAELGHSSLAVAITTSYPGKYKGLRQDLGEKIVSRKDNGYWDDPINVERETREVMREYDLPRAPSRTFLRSIGRSDLDGGINRYPGRYTGLRESFGEEDSRKPMGYWQDWDNIEKEAEKMIREQGKLPGKKVVEKLNPSFAAAVIKYHGGFRKLRSRIKVEQRSVENDHWRDPKNIEMGVEDFKRKEGFDYLPNQSILGELGYGALSAAISLHYPLGFDGYRESNNDFTPDQMRRRTTNKTPTMLILEEKLGEPIDEYLGRTYQTHSSIEIAGELDVTETTILLWLKIFGHKVRKGSESMIFRIRKPTKEKLNRLYWEEGKSKRELLECLDVGSKVLDRWFREYQIETRGRRIDLSKLSRDELIEYGRQTYNGLTVSGVHKNHSGDYKYLQESGMIEVLIDEGIITRIGKKNGYWKNLENVVTEARKIMREHSFETLPGQVVLGRLGYKSFVSSIGKYHGGMMDFRELLNEKLNLPTEEQRLESLLEEYVS